MHFNVEAKVRGCLCIAIKGSLWRSVPPVMRVHWRSCYNYYDRLDCMRDDVLCVRYAANCWLSLLATVRLAVFDKGSLRDGSTFTGWK